MTAGTSTIRTVILCGGRGTRLREYTEAIPKVLVEIGGRPILWHVMKLYAHHGFSDFVLALGYLGESVKRYFVGDRPSSGPTAQVDGWCVTFADTGVDTQTGGRIKRLSPYIEEDVFFATYGDGVADIDLQRLLAFHRAHGRVATVTVTRPRINFGLVEVEGDRVVRFREKPRLDAWINGGFFVFDRRVFEYLDDDSALEAVPMERLAAAGELVAYRHNGFWACMDTYKDQAELNAAWASGGAPWAVWERSRS